MEFISYKKQTILFLLIATIPFVASIYYATQMPISYDEACTFLNLTKVPIENTVLHYIAPNNHILHSLLTKITHQIPYLSLLTKLRISSIIIHLVYLFVLFRLVAKHFNLKAAIVVVAIASMLFMTIYYSYMSRGYGLINLFFIMLLYVSFDLIKEEKKGQKWWLFVVTSVLGFYTIPSFLYPYITLNVFLLYNIRTKMKQLFFSNLIVVIVVILLYLPILINDGIASITNNRFVKPFQFAHTLKRLPSLCYEAVNEITGIHFVFVVALLLFSFYKILQTKNKFNLNLFIILLSAPFVLLAVHGVIPYLRIFNYYGTVFAILMIVPFQDVISKIRFRYLVLIGLVLQLLLLLNFERKIYRYENKDLVANISASKVIPMLIGEKNYYINKVLLIENLEFELIAQGYKNYHIKETQHDAISADSIQDFDFVILSNDSNQTRLRKPLYKNLYYTIYKK